MSNLAVLIYLADIVNNISSICGVITFFGISAVILLSTIGIVAYYEHRKDISAPCFKFAKIALCILCISGIITAVTPSAKTIYIIAGGEAGNQVLHTETAQKALQILNKKMDDYLKESTNE